MAGESISEAVIASARPFEAGGFGARAALALVFQLPDGRLTETTYVPGGWQLDDFLAMLDVPDIAALAGTSLRVVLADASTPRPAVLSLLPSEVPQAFRQAFEEET